MNDFTKEQLEEILAAICTEKEFMRERGYEEKLEDDFLRSKVQYMIENHCEHNKMDDNGRGLGNKR